jgi:hypothetical protein
MAAACVATTVVCAPGTGVEAERAVGQMSPGTLQLRVGFRAVGDRMSSGPACGRERCAARCGGQAELRS